MATAEWQELALVER